MFKAKPTGSITVRKVRKIFPFLLNKEMAQSVIDLAWSLLLVMVPLMTTPKFPRAMSMLWATMEGMEALYEEDDETIDFEKDVEKITELISKELQKVDGE